MSRRGCQGEMGVEDSREIGEEGAKEDAEKGQGDKAEGIEDPMEAAMLFQSDDGVDPLRVEYEGGNLSLMGCRTNEEAVGMMRTYDPRGCEDMNDGQLVDMIHSNGRSLLPRPSATLGTRVHNERDRIKQRPKGMTYNKRKATAATEEDLIWKEPLTRDERSKKRGRGDDADVDHNCTGKLS